MMMDTFGSRLLKTTTYSTNTRTPKINSSKVNLQHDHANKENFLNSSNFEKSKPKFEEKQTYAAYGSSQERKGKAPHVGLHLSNENMSPTYPQSVNTIYTSPKYAEINLLQENFRNASASKYANMSEKKKTRPVPSSSQENSGCAKRSEDYSSGVKGRSKERSLANRDCNSAGLVPFEEKVPEKVTIYTRLLNTMKPSTPKTRENSMHSLPFNPPVNIQRASMDFNNESRKGLLLSGPTINGRLEKNNIIDFPKRNEVIKSSNPSSASLKGETHEEPKVVEVKRDARKNQQEKFDRRNRLSLTKKLTIDIQDSVDTEGESSKNLKGSRDESRNRSAPKVYDSYSTLRKGFDKTGFVAKSSAMDGTLFKNYIKTAKEQSNKEGKVMPKSITPKAGSRQATEIKKLFASSKNLTANVSPVNAQVVNLGNPSGKKDQGTSSYQNILKSGTLKPSEKPNREGLLDKKKRTLSLNKLSKGREKEDFEKKIDEGVHSQTKQLKKPEANSQRNLKDFITQVNPGSEIPFKNGLEHRGKENDQGLKRHFSLSAKNATSKKIQLNSNQNDFSSRGNTDMVSTPNGVYSREEKQQHYIKPRNVREVVVKTDEDESGSYSEFKSDLMIEENHTTAPTYYMTNIERYLRGSSADDEYFEKIYKEHFLQTYQAVNFCRFLKPVDPNELNRKRVYLQKRETHKDKKTLVFDLDETLIHCNENTGMPCDVILPIKFPNGDIIEAGINIRPYALEILEELSKYYEIVVFTASHSCYANVALDYLDPENKYIHHRLFRDHCVTTEEGLYIKDLRILANRDLKDMLIVDNAVYSFGYQLDNGIPIIPFYFNKKDNELKSLISYLKGIYHIKDVREANRKLFKLHLYADSENQDDLFSKIF